jgi:hypothetical protein
MNWRISIAAVILIAALVSNAVNAMANDDKETWYCNYHNEHGVNQRERLILFIESGVAPSGIDWRRDDLIGSRLLDQSSRTDNAIADILGALGKLDKEDFSEKISYKVALNSASNIIAIKADDNDSNIEIIFLNRRSGRFQRIDSSKSFPSFQDYKRNGPALWIGSCIRGE